MSRVVVIIPTVEGRKEYLARCFEGYGDNTEGASTLFLVVPDKPTCGLAWQRGVELAREQLRMEPDDYLHFTADDIVPAPGWFGPFAEAVQRGNVPCGLVIAPIAETLNERGMPIQGAAFAQANFFERPGSDEAAVPDWYPATHDTEYPSIPFCSWAQWERMEPMIAGHYGTDRWFGKRALDAGFQPVARHGAHFYHYAAQPGRVPQYAGWTHQDLITFDLNVAYPEYASGRLEPTQLHPERGMAEGRRMAREWLERHTPRPWFWEDPTLGSEYL